MCYWGEGFAAHRRMDRLFAHLSTLSPDSVYATVTGILLLCGLGIPIPEDVSLIAAGYMAHVGVVSVHKIFVCCFVAVLGGDTLAFGLGHWFGRRLLQARLPQKLFPPRKQRRVRAYFRKYGSKVIFIGRFLPGLRFSIFFSAGTLHVRPSVFLLYDTFAAMLSVPALVYLSWAFGGKIDHVVAWSRRSEWGIAGIVVIAAAVIFLKARKHQKRALARALALRTLPTAPPSAPPAASP